MKLTTIEKTLFAATAILIPVLIAVSWHTYTLIVDTQFLEKILSQ